MKAVFLDFATVSHDDIDPAPLRDVVDELVIHDVSPPESMASRISGFDVVITNKCRINAGLLATPGLCHVALVATGYNNVDIEAARARGIAVSNIRDYCTAAVAQHVYCLLLALNQRLDGYRELLREGAWKRAAQFTLLDFPFHELAGRRLGIIGYGNLGRAVAGIGEAFGMEVMIAERRGATPRNGRVAFETVLREADVISLHCPLTPETSGMIDAAALALMKPDALLINTARGGLVDEQALADALRAGRLGGAGIDVLSEEPPLNGNPLLDTDIPNLIVTPHIAWAAREARQRGIAQVAENLRAWRAGESLRRVV